MHCLPGLASLLCLLMRSVKILIQQKYDPKLWAISIIWREEGRWAHHPKYAYVDEGLLDAHSRRYLQ